MTSAHIKYVFFYIAKNMISYHKIIISTYPVHISQVALKIWSVWSIQIRIQSELHQPSCIPFFSYNLEESFFFFFLSCKMFHLGSSDYFSVVGFNFYVLPVDQKLHLKAWQIQGKPFSWEYIPGDVQTTDSLPGDAQYLAIHHDRCQVWPLN